MKIEATKNPLTVQYRETDKLYGIGSDDTGRASFDEKRLEVGESFVVPGKLIAVREHIGVADSAVDFGHGGGDL